MFSMFDSEFRVREHKTTAGQGFADWRRLLANGGANI